MGRLEPVLEDITKEDYEERLGRRLAEAWETYERLYNMSQEYYGFVHEENPDFNIVYRRNGQQVFYIIDKKKFKEE